MELKTPRFSTAIGSNLYAENVNTSEIAADCIKMCGVNDIADAVAMRKDKFIKRCSLNSSVVCEICSLIVK